MGRDLFRPARAGHPDSAAIRSPLDKNRWKIDIGISPLWSPNEVRELFYLMPHENMKDVAVMAVNVETVPTFNFEEPRELFQGQYVIPYPGDVQTWDIHPDGDKFLMMKPAPISDGKSAIEAPQKINIVLNWFEELKEKVPVY